MNRWRMKLLGLTVLALASAPVQAQYAMTPQQYQQWMMQQQQQWMMQQQLMQNHINANPHIYGNYKPQPLYVRPVPIASLPYTPISAAASAMSHQQWYRPPYTNLRPDAFSITPPAFRKR